MKIAWIGVGVMGTAMVRHLKKEGHEVHLYTRTLEKITNLQNEGFVLHSTISSCIEDCDLICTMVGYPSDVEEVYYSPSGIFSSLNENHKPICIDFTTSKPSLAKKLFNDYPRMFDIPVSGGEVGAKNATLSLMVGGPEDMLPEILPILECLGATITYMGTAGNGQYTKLCNQIALCGSLSGVCESLAFSKKANVDPTLVLDAISKGAAGSWQLQNVAPKIIEKDYTPGFYLKHFLKDLEIAKESAFELSLDLPVLNEVTMMITYLSNNGFDQESTASLIEYYINTEN